MGEETWHVVLHSSRLGCSSLHKDANIREELSVSGSTAQTRLLFLQIKWRSPLPLQRKATLLLEVGSKNLPQQSKQNATNQLFKIISWKQRDHKKRAEHTKHGWADSGWHLHAAPGSRILLLVLPKSHSGALLQWRLKSYKFSSESNVFVALLR